MLQRPDSLMAATMPLRLSMNGPCYPYYATLERRVMHFYSGAREPVMLTPLKNAAADLGYDLI